MKRYTSTYAMLAHTGHVLVMIAALTLATACGDARSGGDDDDDENSAGNNGAGNNSAGNNAVGGNNAVRNTEPYTLSTLDEGCDTNAALTGRSLLDVLADPQVGTLMFTTGNQRSIGLEVSFDTSAPGTITCTPGLPSCPMCGAPDIPPVITVDGVTMGFVTDNGEFDEMLPVEVSGDGFGSGLVRVYSDSPADALTGTFEPILQEKAYPTVVIQGSVSAAIFRGNVGLSEAAPGMVTQVFNVAGWQETP